MTQIKFKGTPANTIGSLPRTGAMAPDFNLVNTSLEEVTLASFGGKQKVLNIFPSVDTPVCAMSVRRFNTLASQKDNTVVLCISADLPFAFKRFCGAEGINNVQTLSTFRSDFARNYGVALTDSPLKGLCSRAVVVLNQDNKVLYTEQVDEITQEPDYDRALAVL
ncbi:MAG: thiol peroxidase [Deltaproteobacteria bacterium]|nr:thiol peroxidase [Deltaproteobacteria bacterium]